MKLLGHDFGAKESVLINGRKFKVKHELGRGGFAIIVLVKDAKTKERFALKRSICREWKLLLNCQHLINVDFRKTHNRNKRTFARRAEGAGRPTARSAAAVACCRWWMRWNAIRAQCVVRVKYRWCCVSPPLRCSRPSTPLAKRTTICQAIALLKCFMMSVSARTQCIPVDWFTAISSPPTCCSVRLRRARRF
jgi:hypothetical protein